MHSTSFLNDSSISDADLFSDTLLRALSVIANCQMYRAGCIFKINTCMKCFFAACCRLFSAQVTDLRELNTIFTRDKTHRQAFLDNDRGVKGQNVKRLGQVPSLRANLNSFCFT